MPAVIDDLLTAGECMTMGMSDVQFSNANLSISTQPIHRESQSPNLEHSENARYLIVVMALGITNHF